jgi:oligopeptidase A
VETLFHEFGHLMHHLLSRVEVRSLACTNVAWDFVELPSMIMENWCWEPEALARFARHHARAEPLPDALLGPLLRAKRYRAANMLIRQLGFAAVDLALHTSYDPAKDGDALSFARAIMQRHASAELPDDYAMLASFGHLFASSVGYAGGYYSYKWAEVLDADAFGRFRREGLFSPEVGGQFRDRILARGNEAAPEALFRDFMGRDPELAALLARYGLGAEAPGTAGTAGTAEAPGGAGPVGAGALAPPV